MMVLRLWKESRGSECLIKILVCSLPKNLENSFYRQQHFPSVLLLSVHSEFQTPDTENTVGAKFARPTLDRLLLQLVYIGNVVI